MNKLSEKQIYERDICMAFIESAKSELGASHEFFFIRCEDENKDPPDVWVDYKGMSVGVELSALHHNESKGDLEFGRKLVELLNEKNTAPIGISLTTERPNTRLYVKDSAKKIFAFVSENEDVLADFERLNERFRIDHGDLAKRIALQPVSGDDKKVRFLPVIQNSMDEQINYFVEICKKKIERIKNRSPIVSDNKIILLLHYDGMFQGGTFYPVQAEELFVIFKNSFFVIDPERIIFRCYIFSRNGVRIFGHQVRVIQIR